MNEMNGQYNHHVIPEDLSDEGFIDLGLYPNYNRILRDTIGGQELLKQEKERSLGVGSNLGLSQAFIRRETSFSRSTNDNEGKTMDPLQVHR